MPVTFKIWTLGCKVNQYESQVVREQLLAHGYTLISNGAPADVYLINTCTVTAISDRKSRKLIYKARRENAHARIVVTGCFAQREHDVLAELEGVDLVVGNTHKEKLAEYIDRLTVSLVEPRTIRACDDIATVQAYMSGSISYFHDRTRAYVKVQDGCNKGCSYCIIPSVRGRSRSRGADDILEEVKRLADNGVREIVLCGICLSSYGYDLRPVASLADLCVLLEAVDGISRIRLSSLEPEQITEQLIAVSRSSEKLCHHFHLSLQSGSDAVLAAMRRGYTRDKIWDIIRLLKEHDPNTGFSADIMVGFPGETDSDLQDTIDLCEFMEPLKLHIFPYSQREGTAAAHSLSQVAAAAKKERVQLLHSVANKLSLQYRQRFYQQKCSVLVENTCDKETGLWSGYTREYMPVLIEEASSALCGVECDVIISRITNERTYGNCI